MSVEENPSHDELEEVSIEELEQEEQALKAKLNQKLNQNQLMKLLN